MYHKLFMEILKELKWPNIYLVLPEQFEHSEGESMKSLWGMASDIKPIITMTKVVPYNRTVVRNILYHEVGHKLWPWKPEWWIECFGCKMAGGGGTGYYSNKYGHTIDELPSRRELLKLARRAVERYNKKTIRSKP